MDKYEYKLKLDEMKSLSAAGRTDEAAEIADTINWHKVKNANDLVKAGEVYEKVDRFEESREFFLMAYDRSPIGRTIICHLAEIAIKMGNFDEAEDYYQEFVGLAPQDNLKYVLKYQINRAKGADVHVLIQILEELKEQEYSEEWAYELIKLYRQAGMEEKCVDACDELILWFGDGPYVERALEIKMLYRPLNEKQEEKYRMFHPEIGGITEVKQESGAALSQVSQETMQIPKIQYSPERFNTVNLQKELQKGIRQIMEATGKEGVHDGIDSLMRAVEELPSIAITKEFKLPEPIETSAEEVYAQYHPTYMNMLAEERDGQMSLMIPDSVKEPQVSGQMNIGDLMADWEAAQKEADRRNLEAARTRAMREAGEIMEQLAEFIPVLDSGITPQELLKQYSEDGNLEEEAAAELVVSMNQMLQEQIERYSQEQAWYDAKIAAAHAMNEDERLEKMLRDLTETSENGPVGQEQDMAVGNEQADFTEAEFGRTAAGAYVQSVSAKQADDGQSAAVPADSQFSADGDFSGRQYYGTDLSAESQNTFFDGNADFSSPNLSAQDESAVAEFGQNNRCADEFADQTTDAEWDGRNSDENAYEMQTGVSGDGLSADEAVIAPAGETEEFFDNAENKRIEYNGETEYQENTGTKAHGERDAGTGEHTGTVPTDAEISGKTSYEKVDSYRDTLQPDTERYNESGYAGAGKFEEAGFSGDNSHTVAGFSDDQPGERAVQPGMGNRTAGGSLRSGYSAKNAAQKDVSDDIEKRLVENLYREEMMRQEKPREKKTAKPAALLTREQRKIFTYFVSIKGMEQQLCQVLAKTAESLKSRKTAAEGNLMIQGEQGSGKTVLAKAMAKALKKTVGQPSGKVGTIEASKLNRGDTAALTNFVAGGCLIIEKVGDISRETADKLAMLLASENSKLFVIIEDTRAGITKAFAKSSAFASCFTHKIIIPIFTNDELVTFAKSYSNELGYMIDEMGVLALYNSISSIQKLDHATTLSEIKEIVDGAISHVEKRGIKKIMSIITSSRYDADDYVILHEKDFNA